MVPREKTELEAIARETLEVSVAEIVSLNRALIFVTDIRAGDAFVVSSDHERHSGLHVLHKRMVGAADAENEIVASEGDLNGDVLLSHLAQQVLGFGVVHDV